MAARLRSQRSISAGSPPIDFGPAQPVQRVLDRQHRGRVDRLALEDALDQLAALGQTEQLGQRPGRLVAISSRSTARGEQHQHAVLRLAAQHLLPGPGHDIELVPGQLHRERGRGGVAQGEARAIVGDPVAVGHPDARGGAVPAEHGVARRIHRAEVRQRAIGCDQRARIGELAAASRCRSASRRRSSRTPPRRRRARPAGSTSRTRMRRCPRRAGCRSDSRRECPGARATARSPRRRRAFGAAARCERPSMRALQRRPATSPAAWRSGRSRNSDCAGRTVGSIGDLAVAGKSAAGP